MQKKVIQRILLLSVNFKKFTSINEDHDYRSREFGGLKLIAVFVYRGKFLIKVKATKFSRMTLFAFIVTPEKFQPKLLSEFFLLMNSL